jgi:hypothetical protein
LRVYWNSFEPPVPLDIGNDPQDYIVELNSPSGSQLTIKRTQINGAGEVWLTINGRLGGSGVKPEAVIVPGYSIRAYTYENDGIASNEAPILSYVLKGKTLRLVVDISP